MTDDNQKQKFIDEAKNKTNLTAGPCSVSTKSSCSNSNQPGTMIQSYTQSYAGYAVIREKLRNVDVEETQEQASMPANSYIYYVDTPTTDKKQVVDATYKGMVSYSRKNTGAVTSNGALTLNVKDDHINGNVITGVGTKQKEVMAFNNAEIKQTNGRVEFAGDVTFRASSFSNKDKKDFDGVYHGEFAGANAEQVVGVFESKDNAAVKRLKDNGSDYLDSNGYRVYDADKAVQGAFWGSKE